MEVKKKPPIIRGLVNNVEYYRNIISMSLYTLTANTLVVPNIIIIRHENNIEPRLN
jgi:hypothetical protein